MKYRNQKFVMNVLLEVTKKNGKANMSELGRRLGVTRAYVQQLASGKYNWSENIVKIIRALSGNLFTYDYLFEEEVK